MSEAACLAAFMVPFFTFLGFAYNLDHADVKPYERTGIELCKDVSVEVAKSVEADLLSAEEANNIINRCFTLFGGEL